MELGRIGELLFQQKMLDKGYVVQDVSKDSTFYYVGDFIVTSPYTGETKTFEIKYDAKMNKTGNLYLEVAAAKSVNGIGWWEYCKADYLAYGDAVTGIFFVADLQELRDKVQHLPKRVAQCGNESIGYLVELDAVKDIMQQL